MSKQVMAGRALILLALIVCVAQIVLIVCKLCRVVDWSWWIVLMPLWIDYALSILAGIVFSVYRMIICRKNRR